MIMKPILAFNPGNIDRTVWRDNIDRSEAYTSIDIQLTSAITHCIVAMAAIKQDCEH